MKNKKTLRLAQLSLLVALEIIMAYTPLGYLRTPGLEISFMMVPVTLGAILLGPSAGALLGGIFGLTSFGTCFGTSVFGAALLNISFIKTFILCFVTRVLVGWITGVIFKALQNKKDFKFLVTALVGPILNTVLFTGALVLLFYGTDYIQSFVTSMGASNPFTFMVLFVGAQGAIEAVVCGFIGVVLGKSLFNILRSAH